jgi:altronate dehydratase
MVNATLRMAVPLNQLKIALQCGGSDAFSGVSGNPLAAWMAKEVIRYGGSTNMAETDELVGAEKYMLSLVRDRETADSFLQLIDRFQTWASWHGHSVAGNPSGGNLYRGLYNIYLKSIGAAVKRDPQVPLDLVIDYAAPMTEGGFYFMDSPGNDLESVAGQVAAGCNLIFFVTGNGSITNFPFVPTIKIVTTSQRYAMLTDEMDVNAGAYLEDTPLPVLGTRYFNLMLDVISGELVAGEKAGHAQVQIWRDWQQTEANGPAALSQPQVFSGRPHPIETAESISPSGWQAGDKVCLIIPTSLCAGQIARMCADRLNRQGLGQEHGFSGFVALPHTEGCGASTQTEFIDIMLGYATHPLVGSCLLLEHGCEKTHNAFWRRQMLQENIDPDRFGWASIQMDGGIQTVMARIAAWFERDLAGLRPAAPGQVGLKQLSLGFVTDSSLTDIAAGQLAVLTQWIVSAGGTVVLPSHDQLLVQNAYLDVLKLPTFVEPTLNYARRPVEAGLHIMQTPSTHWSETLTGMGATGVQIMLAMVGKRPLPGHPFIPVLQTAEETAEAASFAGDLDGIMSRQSGHLWANQLIDLLADTLTGVYVSRQNRQENVDFQITRGLLGVSL